VRIALALVLLAFPATAPAAPLRIASLSTVLTEFILTVGGPDVAVTGVIRPGVDPHTFEPSPRDLAGLRNFDLILAAGLDLDPGLVKAVRNAGGSAAWVNLSPDPDPHWWNSVVAAETIVRRLTAELSRRRPAAAGGFTARSTALLSELSRLDQDCRRRLDAIAPRRRILITTHDAFAWFAHDYGFQVYSLSGVNAEAEPNAREVARIVDEIRRAGVATLFFESAANPHLISALAEETGARAGGMLYADGLSPDGDGATYAGMVRHNISTLVDGLK
jgi:zinc/manganese transport system substrate-binding protein